MEQTEYCVAHNEHVLEFLYFPLGHDVTQEFPSLTVEAGQVKHLLVPVPLQVLQDESHARH